MQRVLQEAASLAVAVVVLSGCNPQRAAERAHVVAPPSPRRAPSAYRITPLHAMRGVNCTKTDGAEHCATDRYDLSGSPTVCDEHSTSFGAVFSPVGADLATDVDDAGTPRAHVANKQLVCIQYTADSKSGAEGWSYVVALPASLVARCAKAGTCPAAASPIQWHGATPTSACAVVGGVYSDACAQGWVESSLIDAYSMGLEGEHAEP